MGMDRFIKMCLGADPAMFRHLTDSLLGGWDRVQLRHSNFLGFSLAERVVLLLLDLSDNFGVPNPHGGVRLTLPVRHGDLAELVGASRPRVTEHLLELRQKRLIFSESGSLVVDHAALKGFLIAAHPDRFSEDPG